MEPELLQRWCEAGELPTLAHCIETGVSGRLRSTFNQLTASAWVTVATGANPGAHGIYNFQERVPGEYRLKLPNARDRKLPAFWELASDHGCTVATARVPMSFPLRPVNGVGIADWLAPSPKSPGFAHPSWLVPDLLRRFGYGFWLEPYGDNPPSGSGRYYQVLRDLGLATDKTYTLFRYLLSLGRPDLFFGVLREADAAGHFFWGFHEGLPRGHDGYLSRDLQHAILSVYRRIDQGLGRFLKETGYSGNLIILSDHGMGPLATGPQYVAPLLEAAGLMLRNGNGHSRQHPLRGLKASVCRQIPWYIRRRLKPLDQDARSRGFTASLLSSIDFSSSQAFSYFGLLTGEIWLNVRGRDPLGMVEPGAEQHRLEEEIVRLFTEAECPVSGRRPVREVKRRGELFSGDHMGILADLHVGFHDGLQIAGLTTRLADGTRITVGAPAGEAPQVGGCHRPYGAFIACGPDLKAHRLPIEGDPMDLAPTALALLGVPIPEHMEGRVLTEAVADWVAPCHAAAGTPCLNDAPDPAYTQSELGLIESRLRQLGYLERTARTRPPRQAGPPPQPAAPPATVPADGAASTRGRP